jgi:two-component system, NtrC family, response regulator HydG
MNERSQKPMRILVVDDEKVVRDSLTQWLKEDSYDVRSAADAKEALLLLKEKPWDLALIDIKMPGMDGLELQHRIRDASPATAVIIMTAFASVDTAVQALKDGAFDYITKPFDPDHLNHLLRNISERRKLSEENRELRERLVSAVDPQPILGLSPGILHALDLIRTVAPTDTSVLITGESGTGKELVARAVHAGSPRAFMPLVVVNCGALPEGTLESELFGHERGAFTGAHYRHKGKFELADGGSLFLDEIGEVSPRIQVELLRVLEEKKVTRLGDTKPVQADFRLIAATNKDLAQEVMAGRFREDLYYRINVFHIPLPPLCERKEDIPLLARALVERLARSMNMPLPELTPEAVTQLCAYDWPGNVRELANALERAMVVSRGGDGRLRPEHLPIVSSPHVARNGSSLRSLADLEREHIERILRETDWNISRTAMILGVDRSTVYNKIKLHELKKA